MVRRESLHPFRLSPRRHRCHLLLRLLYLHNQTVNIFTHLIPGIAALVINIAFLLVFAYWYPESTFTDRLVFHVYLTACSICFGTSATYHTLLCHSHDMADLWVRLDYVSISVLILSSFIPGLYMGFYCEPFLLRAYLTMVSYLFRRPSMQFMRLTPCRSSPWASSTRISPFTIVLEPKTGSPHDYCPSWLWASQHSSPLFTRLSSFRTTNCKSNQV